MNKVQPVVIAVIKKNKKYLLTKRVHKDNRFHNKWNFPGGALEYGETFEKALRREIKEELGISLGKLFLIPYIHEVIRDDWHGILIPFLTYPEDGQTPQMLDEDSCEFGWFFADEIKHLDVLSGAVELVLNAEKVSGRGLEPPRL